MTSFVPAKLSFSVAVLCTGCLLAFTLLTPAGATSRKEEMQSQGAELFANKGCAHCHGPAGFGGSNSGPDLSLVRNELKAKEIAQQIHDGANNMPPFGDSLSEDEIAALVEYLRSKRKPPSGFRRPGKNSPAAAVPTQSAQPDPD